ncbi:MAG: AlpA family transcriptional regulator [Novosphingobium pentaromativorans]|uniref:AlpA family transcriptional regulator n=1 Tax=Novosphingobium pentaromativorans TaxID=205844 RepID=A0A2W5NFI0_9SPHN|nr:AlpA family transcriptional regulator [Novosphingobium panipatense]PZQ50979.1 MAG: AlpA family transcriptional regulator [Novosphingobium pentaromativorans]
MNVMPRDRFLRIKEVVGRTGLSRATVYRKIEAGTFPEQVHISERCCGWRESAITEWMRDPATYSVDDFSLED